MQGASRESLALARERLDQLLGQAGTDGAALGQALFAVVDLLDANVAVRRALTDPSHDGESKSALVARLLDGKASADVVAVVQSTVRGRWSRSGDLPDALEQLAGTAVIAGAEAAGRADRVEDEIFRFEWVVDGDPELARAMADRSAPSESKTQLLRDLLSSKAAPESEILISRTVLAQRGRNLDQALEQLVDLAAARREQLVAHVRVAAELSDDHRARLAAALTELYGKQVQLNVDVDPQVVGGIRVEIGDEVLDGTVARKLDDVRRRLAH
jgi:F-type H+-transporting ATPase subunit delta